MGGGGPSVPLAIGPARPLRWVPRTARRGSATCGQSPPPLAPLWCEREREVLGLQGAAAARTGAASGASELNSRPTRPAGLQAFAAARHGRGSPCVVAVGIFAPLAALFQAALVPVQGWKG